MHTDSSASALSSSDKHSTIRSPLLTPRQAAAFLGFSTSTLAKWRTQGNGPVYIKLGAAVRYRRADLDSFVERARLRNSTSEVGAAA